MQKFKKIFMGVYWATGTLFFGSIFFAQCGGDPTPSSELTVQKGDPSGTTDRTSEEIEYKPNYSNYKSRDFIDDEQVRQAILNDLKSLDRRDQSFARYLTLTNLYNQGVEGQRLETARFGLSKLVNSLSWEREIANPVPIDNKKTIFRIDLRDYDWRRGTWNLIVRSNPYAIVNTGSRLEQEINQRTRSQKAYVRGDWFAFSGSQGFLYEKLLGLPNNIRNLEFAIGVNGDRNVANGNVMRVGFTSSNVSLNNRIFERHQSRFGGYWKSYDFQAPEGDRRKNILEFPLGGDGFRGGNVFDFDGGEVIWHLPNGLQAYALIDAQGNLIDKGPIDIVSDASRFRRSPEVVNALGCMSCHDAGLKPKKDEIRPHVTENAQAYSRFTVQKTRQIYPDNDELKRQFKEDNKIFRQAMSQVGYGNKTGYNGKNEPVVTLANYFDSELNTLRAATELGIEPDRFRTGLKRAASSRDTAFLARRLGILLQENGQVRREIFEDNFSNLVRAFGLGNAFRKKRFNPYSAKKVQNTVDAKDLPSLPSQDD